MITLLLGLFLSASEPPNSVRLLKADELLPAMRNALGDSAIQIEVVEVSHFPAPQGEIEFSRKELSAPVSSQGLARWRGYILYGDGRRFSIWADVKLMAPCLRVIATDLLAAEVRIQTSQLKDEAYEGFPSDSCSLRREDIVGLVPVRPVAAGTPLMREMLAPPAAVHRGQEAIAEYWDGAVHLSLTVVAQRNGRIGEIIPVLNPSSHKVLQARVAAIGTVTVEGSMGIR